MTVLPLLLVCFTSIKPPLVPRASPPTSARKRRCCDCECEIIKNPIELGFLIKICTVVEDPHVTNIFFLSEMCNIVQVPSSALLAEDGFHLQVIPKKTKCWETIWSRSFIMLHRKNGFFHFFRKRSTDALLVKIHNPVFLWKVYGFSALLQRGALAAKSAAFHCSGYNWYLKVSPMHKTLGDGTPHVALSLVLSRLSFKPDYTMNAVFVLSMYNHSKGNFLVVKEVLFLQKKKFVSVQNLFLQKKDFTKGDYTWTMNNFPELDLKPSVLSPAFEIGRRKWFIRMYPRGDEYSTNSLSMYLFPQSWDKLLPEPGMMIELTLSILNQNNAQLHKVSGRFVFASKNGWGWSNFIALNKLKDLVGSSCIVKADITIIGSSSESQIVYMLRLIYWRRDLKRELEERTMGNVAGRAAGALLFCITADDPDPRFMASLRYFSEEPHQSPLICSTTVGTPGLKEDIVVDTTFELSIYNHSRRTHHGTRASYKFHYPKYYSEYTYLIPLSKLQDGSDFLADDTCVFGLDILRARKFKPTRNAKGVTIQHVFLQTKGFMQGNYTWNIEDSKLDLKSIICSPKFDIGEHKWYLRVDPYGDYRNRDYVSIYLCLDDNSNMPPIESAIMAEFIISILNQKNGKHSQQKARTVFSCKGIAWGWHKFIRRDQMKNTNAGFVVGSSWTVQAEVTVIGSSSHA
ncbi:Os10g0478500 [Oryza sativa Japonica Group]|uniref:MATH domain containing protein n=2 Tax=Oryza sativa subsp. japonica TaxID=39947 RepID=Q7XDC5_ORYSJ|nr:MATH domain containing protein [Oryza sativa Japonica Group]BAH94938.1 Os10g0478500 [Oryza sativa Japonica Group]|eukprot:NP_001176210.1 Os10g0478500 [Oryza sativa Japonica Group]